MNATACEHVTELMLNYTSGKFELLVRATSKLKNYKSYG